QLRQQLRQRQHSRLHLLRREHLLQQLLLPLRLRLLLLRPAPAKYSSTVASRPARSRLGRWIVPTRLPLSPISKPTPAPSPDTWAASQEARHREIAPFTKQSLYLPVAALSLTGTGRALWIASLSTGRMPTRPTRQVPFW